MSSTDSKVIAGTCSAKEQKDVSQMIWPVKRYRARPSVLQSREDRTTESGRVHAPRRSGCGSVDTLVARAYRDSDG